MSDAFTWPAVDGWTTYLSAGRTSLQRAFADVVKVRHGFEASELAKIWSAPSDDGENDACRHLLQMDSAFMAHQFVEGRLVAIARPINGGDLVRVEPVRWEIDDPLPRFAIGLFNFRHWADPHAEATHRLFIENAEFDHWLLQLDLPGPLSQRECDGILDPRTRAARAIARRDRTGLEPVDAIAPVLPPAHSRPGRTDMPELLALKAVIALTTMQKSSIYAKMDKGTFPRNFDLGGSSRRWLKSDVLEWIAEQAARRKA